MIIRTCLSFAVASTFLAACDGCAQGTPGVRIEDNDPLPVDSTGAGGNGGDGELDTGGGTGGSGCAELGPCDAQEGEDEQSAEGEGEGEGDDSASEGEGETEPPPPQLTCTDQTFRNGERVPPRILLAVDKSGSMANAVGGDYPGSKWSATRSTITQVVESLDDDASFGLMMFPGANVDANLCATGDEYVPMQSNAASAIAASLNAVTTPRGATPTAASLRDAKAVLDALPAAGGTRAVVLATDGGPNCNVNLDGNTCRCTPTLPCGPDNPFADTTYLAPANCIDDDGAVAATRALNDAGYAVFVVGIPGIDGLEDVMNALADAGGTARAGAIRYYDARTSTDLANALESAAFRISTCRFDLAAPVASPDDVTVRINGVQIAQNAAQTHGWDLVDDDTIELFGTTCTDGANASGGVVITACR